MELNNTIATPLYKQLEEKLQHEIETGERPAGSRLPTENELSETYHVSRVTVRKALAGLSELGYLDRKSGKGTFVAEKKLHRSITEVISFTDMCRMMNATAGAKTIKIALEEPSEREIKEMSLKPGEKILVLERIRYMDDEPVIIELNKFPESFSFLFGEDLNDTSLFEVLKKHNIILDHSRKTLDIIFASPQEARRLILIKVIRFFGSKARSTMLRTRLQTYVSSYVSVINLLLLSDFTFGHLIMLPIKQFLS